MCLRAAARFRSFDCGRASPVGQYARPLGYALVSLRAYASPLRLFRSAKYASASMITSSPHSFESWKERRFNAGKYKKSSKSSDSSQFCENQRKQTFTSAKRDVLSIAYDHEIRALDASKSEALNYPLKEVIHPHVPVGIPCYDFTPVAVRSVGGCLACALAHRLRVQTTPMV